MLSIGCTRTLLMVDGLEATLRSGPSIDKHTILVTLFDGTHLTYGSFEYIEFRSNVLFLFALCQATR